MGNIDDDDELNNKHLWGKLGSGGQGGSRATMGEKHQGTEYTRIIKHRMDK